MVVVDQEEVIEVSADLLRRIHGCEDLKFLTVRESGEDTGNHSLLDLACHIEFRMNAFLLNCDVGKILHIILHISFHICQEEAEVFDLIPCGYVETGEMAGAQCIISVIIHIMRGSFCNLVDRLDNCPPHLTPHEESKQDRYDENCGEVLEGEAFYSLSDVGKRNVREDKCYDLAVAVPERGGGGTEPSVIPGLSDGIEHSLSVPVQKISDFISLRTFPVTWVKACRLIVIRIGNVDERSGFQVIRSQIECGDFRGIQKIMEDFHG